MTAAMARADVDFAEPQADADQVRAGVPLSHRFVFTNKGPETIELIQLRASCGCLKPRAERRTYEPGQQGAITLDVHTLGQPAGPHTWKLYVNYRIGDAMREAALQLKAEVVTEVCIQPASVTVIAESAVSQEILLTDLREKPLSISSLQTSSPKLTTRLAGAFTDEMGRPVRKIQLDIAADYPEGRHEEVVDIFTDDPSYRDLRVPVTIVKRSAQKLTVLPARADLLVAPGQEVPSKIVLIRPSGEQPVVVESVEADDAAVACQWARGPGAMATLRINVDRTKVNGQRLDTTVRVHVREPIVETLAIPVTCTLE